MRNVLKRTDKYFWFATAIIAAGCAVRLFALGSIPCGLNQDEAFAGYNAWALLHYDVDSSGYHNPVYFTAWGSGMNALESYLMIPFVALFGTGTAVLRLPQALMACLSLICVYDLGKHISGRRFALCAVAVLATSPWHIMMARWALESNLSPAFLLLGLCFFVRGLSRGRWLYASAAAYGFSLYTYATIWPIVPILVLAQAAYALWMKKLRLRNLIGPSLVLFLLALPLLWFLGVQMGYLPEIRTAFFSIPKMPEFRGSEISFSHLFHNWETALSILVHQGDGLTWNSFPPFGLYFPFWFVPFFIGLGAACFQFIRATRAGQFSFLAFPLFNLLAGILLCGMIEVNVNRMNAIHIPILLLIAYGLYLLCQKFSTWAKASIVLLYGTFFALFSVQYFSVYNTTISTDFREGLRQSVVYAQTVREDAPLHISQDAYFSQVLLFAQVAPQEFSLSDPYHFSDISIGPAKDAPAGAVYVGPLWEVAEYANQGYAVTPFAQWGVAVPPAE